MIILTLAFTQATAIAPPPVVRDPPPGMLFAFYDQCLGREVNQRLSSPMSAEEVFDQSQEVCAHLLDEYVSKLTSTIVMTNIDYQREKAKFVSAMRSAVVALVTKKRISLVAQEGK